MRIVRSVLAALLLAVLPLSATAQDAIDPAEREKVEQIVRDYLLQNPEVILEALHALEQRQQQAADQERAQTIASLKPTLAASPLTPIVGNPDGDVTLIEFFDYQCGFCKRFFPGLQTVMEEDEGLKVIFVEFPILGPASLTAARAALAAQRQDRYMDMHIALMEFQGRLTDEVVFETATELGLDMDQLRADMEAPEILDYLRTVRELADTMDIRGTPAMVVGDRFVNGFVPPVRLREEIAAVRDAG